MPVYDYASLPSKPTRITIKKLMLYIALISLLSGLVSSIFYILFIYNSASNIEDINIPEQDLGHKISLAKVTDVTVKVEKQQNIKDAINYSFYNSLLVAKVTLFNTQQKQHSNSQYALQVYFYHNNNLARSTRARLLLKGIDSKIKIVVHANKQDIYVLSIEEIQSRSMAYHIQNLLTKMGINNTQVFLPR